MGQFYLNEHGSSCQSMPISVDGKTSVMRTIALREWRLYPMFPSETALADFELDPAANDVVRGEPCDTWVATEHHYDETPGYVGKYRYLTSARTSLPMRFSMVGHNVGDRDQPDGPIIIRTQRTALPFNFLITKKDWN